MPKGGKSVTVLCGELGMDAVAENNFRKETQQYLKDQIGDVADVANAGDTVIENLAWKYLDDGGGAKHFSWERTLNYQWEASDHRQTISHYTNEIMCMQRWYIIDRLHKRVGGALNCPGCLLHDKKPTAQRSSTDQKNEMRSSYDNSVLELEDSDDDLHRIISKSAGNKKRERSYLDHDDLPQTKRRRSGVGLDDVGALSGAQPVMQLSGTLYGSAPPPSSARPGSGFTAVNRSEGATDATEVAPPPDHETQPSPVKPIIPGAAAEPSTLKDSDLTMHYRGKRWQFLTITHKARVLEQLLVHEERDVESFPIVAFSKGARKAASGGEDDAEGTIKDYFRFYTHFMTERFPGNEKMLLENGVLPVD